MAIAQNFNNLFYVDFSGNVGIQNSSPTYALDVIGFGNFSSGVLVNGSPLTASGSGSANTGELTGAFYPLGSNPSGYITSAYTGNLGSGYFPLQIQSAKLPNTNPARLDAGELNWKLLFHSGINQSGIWQFIMPANYNASLQARILFTTASTQVGSNAVVWRPYLASFNPSTSSLDVATPSFGNNSGVHSLAASQTAGLLRREVVPLTSNTGVAGDYMFLSLVRDAASASDTAVGDVELIGLMIEYRI